MPTDTDTSPTTTPDQPASQAEPSAPETSPASSGEVRSSAQRLFDRIFGSRRDAEQPAAPESPSTDVAAAESSAEPAQPRTDQPTAAAEPETFTLTKDELERRIQAETDRREARRKLRREDPYEHAQQEEAAEDAALASTLFEESVRLFSQEFDKGVIDPVLAQLSEDQRREVLALDGVGAGLDGRGRLLAEAVQRLVSTAKAEARQDAEQSLRKNAAFRQQVLSEARQSDGYQEPESVPGAEGTRQPVDMNTWMLAELGRTRRAHRQQGDLRPTRDGTPAGAGTNR